MDKINFTINGESYALVGSQVSPKTSLNDFLRNHVNIRGTKAMCHEGGCGACIVCVTQTHPVTKEKQIFSVNSCLVHILSCHQWDITTVEGVGNVKDGYHQIQTRLASFNGTQCGFCTPGWIMNMYSLYKSQKKKLTSKQIENSFAGNICRCTGYRPILDAFKSFATNPDNELHDLEDLPNLKCLKKECDKILDDDWCVLNSCGSNEKLCIEMTGSRWYKAFKVEDVFNIMKKENTDSYRFVAGNTGRGVYPIKNEPKILIDISSIEALKDISVDVNLILGAGMSLSEVMMQFQKFAEKLEFRYLKEFYNHLDLVAHLPVRNIGTIGGNLAMKNKHKEFPSDIFLILATVEAAVTILDANLKTTVVSMKEFLNMDLTDKLIYSVKLPPLSSSYLIKTYKIMPRAQNAHAILNAGFLFKLKDNTVESSNIVYGCIDENFVNASKTSQNLQGKNLFDEQTLQTSLAILKEELAPKVMPPEATPYCRKNIALGLFYRTVLNLAPKPMVNNRYITGGTGLNRPISKGSQTFDTDKSLWPLNKPLPKLEALIQCSGEAKYTNDLSTLSKEVFVCFVLANVCGGDIQGFDAATALKFPGVLGFYTAKDIRGKNTFTPTSVLWQQLEEPILAKDKVTYYGQPVGLIAAVTHKVAEEAAMLVKVTYKNEKTKPVLSIKDALDADKTENRVREDIHLEAKDRGSNTTHVIKGAYNIPSQYHYTMETQNCVVIPEEGNFDVIAATQWMDLVHVAVANCLNVPENRVNVKVYRLGGGYGGKASRSSLVATSCAIVAQALNRPARMTLSLTDNMSAIGKRQPCWTQYEVGINDEGEIQYVNLKYYSDSGHTFNDASGGEILGTLSKLYDVTRWDITGYSVLTDKANNTWCRAPATTEGSAILEHIMERIAHKLKKDSTDIKILNLAAEHYAVKDMILNFKMECDFESRMKEVTKFNEDNCWKKRAIKLSTMSYPIVYGGNYSVTISVYQADGTVAICHGGIEMGQGINTKVAQVCAHTLRIPLEKISIKPPNNFVSPNAIASSGSVTSECVSYAVLKASQGLLTRLEPLRVELGTPTWEELVKEAYNKGINLQTSYMTSVNDNLVEYNVYGVTIAEIELDILTGTHLILRVDILEDTGQSLNPDIDVGQIEGAFIMGLGLWTCENLQYDTKTGRLLTNRTWNYKPPGVKDIPIDFRISFKRNSFNPAGVLRSKATGEPALVMTVVITHALHDAILEGRKEFGYEDTEWIQVENPYTVDNIMQALGTNTNKFKLK